MSCLPFQCFLDSNIVSIPPADWGRAVGNVSSVVFQQHVDSFVSRAMIFMGLWESTWKASFCFLFTACFLLTVCYLLWKLHNIIPQPQMAWRFLFSTHYVCLSGLYHTQYFQRLSSNSSGNKHFTTRQLLKQGTVWPCTVNTRPFIRNGTKITFTWLPNTTQTVEEQQWGTLGAHPMGCQGTRVTSRCPPML